MPGKVFVKIAPVAPVILWLVWVVGVVPVSASTQFQGVQDPMRQATASPVPSGTMTPTAQPDRQPAGTPSPAPSSSRTLFLPLMMKYDPAGRIFICRRPELDIPDGDPTGVVDRITIEDRRTVRDVNIYLKIRHTFISDLVVRLNRPDTGQSIAVLDRPGRNRTATGCFTDDITAVLDDEMTLPGNEQCHSSSDYRTNASFGRLVLPAISGMYTPKEPLSRMDGRSAAGEWEIQVGDTSAYDQGVLESWCLELVLGGLPEDEPSSAPALPAEARIWNISGRRQALPLDCEARLAVDYAAFYGVAIDEQEFFAREPKSDDPDSGFVGDVWGRWGTTPPEAYGIHAAPVAELLRSYGVPAYANRPLRWDDLRTEVASGRPVFAWTISSGGVNGIPEYYTAASNDHRTIVAPYQHSVMVIGYSPSTVTVMDGGQVKIHTLDQFLQSWSALGNMAITAVQYR